MVSTRRSPLQREKDLARTEELSLRGYTHAEIAGEMGVTREQITQDLKRISLQYAQSTLRNYQADLTRQLRKLDLLERSAWRFLADSEQDREITTRRQRTRENEDGTSTTREAGTRIEQRDPDTRYMTVIQWCIAERNRLLNLYPAEEPRQASALNVVTEIVYELAPQHPTSGMTVIGGGGQAALVDGQVEVLATPKQETEQLEPAEIRELWGVDEDDSDES